MLATYVRFDTPMIDVPGDSFLLSTNQILVRRTRLILLICLVGGFVFTMLQVAIWRPGSEPTLIVHLIGLVAATTGLIVLQNAWAVRHAWTMAIAAVSAAYVLTAIGRAVECPPPERFHLIHDAAERLRLRRLARFVERMCAAPA